MKVNEYSHKIVKLSLSDNELIKKMNKDKMNCNAYKLNRGWSSYIELDTYSHFITVTFKYNYMLDKSYEYLNKLLHYVNRCLYGKKYIENKTYLQGFLFVEKHLSGKNHFHILISDKSKLNECDKDLDNIFNYCTSRVTSNKGKSGYVNLPVLVTP